MLQARFRGIVSQLIIPGCEKTKHEYQGEEHNYERDVSAQTSAEEHETNERHDDGVVSLSGIILLAQSTGHRDPVDGRGVGGGYAVQRIVEKSEVDPVHAEDYEDGEGEAVAEYEFADSGDGHGDTAEHVEGSADGDEGGGGGALEGEEREDGGGEGDEEAEEAEEGGVSCMGLEGEVWRRGVGTYRVVSRDLLWQMRVGRIVVRIDRCLAGELFDGRDRVHRPRVARMVSRDGYHRGRYRVKT